MEIFIKYWISGKDMETQTAKLPIFQGKPLIGIPEFSPQIGFLGGDFGKAFLEEYLGRTKVDYEGNRVLNILKYDNGIIKGSNPFAVVLANQILRQNGLRTATHADLERALKVSALSLRGTYEDTGLVLISEEDRDHSTNTYLAKDLAKQVKARGIKFSPKNPAVIPLTGLELQTTQDNDYVLTFKLREDAEVYEAPILSEDGQFNSEDIDEKTGLPRKLGQGSRTLYVIDSGLSRLCLNGDLDLYSYSRYLDNSGDDGRVVVVSGEATSPKNLQAELIERINTQYKAQLDDLNARRAEAERAVQEIMSRKK